MRNKCLQIGLSVLAAVCLILTLGTGAAASENKALDERVQKFLERKKNQWRDLNVPEEDGKILFEIVLRNGYRRALEIGTSTGHSAIWIAWALSKTGGKLVTVEIDEGRHRRALANFREAGLDAFIDARLGDARQLVKTLPGPFDFVFLDADQENYLNYAKTLASKIVPGGCLSAHNVFDPGPGAGSGSGEGPAEYFRYMKSLPEFATEIHPRSVYGIAVSYRKKN